MKKNNWLAMLTLLVSLPLLMGQALAAPTGIDGLAQGDDFLVSRATSLRSSPSVAYNDDLDEYLIVWTDTRDNVLYADVYGQIISSAGVPRGDNFVIRDEATNLLVFPDVAYDTDNGRYLVVWEDDTEKDIEGQLLDQDGSPFGSAFNVMDGSSGDPAATPAVAFHPPTSTYFVAYRRGASGDYDIQGKRVSAAGTVGASDWDISSAAGDQTDPDVSANPATGGNFLIVWEDGRAAADQVYGAWFNPLFNSLSVEIVISTHATEARTKPAAAFSPDADEWLVVFERDAAGDSQIVGRRVASDGTPTGNNFGICGDAGDQLEPDVAYDADSQQFLVAWEDQRDGANPGIYGRYVASGGGTVGAVFAINTAAGNQFGPVVAASPAAPGYLVVFVDLNPSLVEDIVGQRVATAGYPTGSLLTVSAPVGIQRQPAVAYNSTDGEYLVVWHDQRAGNWDIWGQRLDLDGSPLGGSFAICSETSTQLYPDVAYNLDTNQYLVVWEDRRADADIYGQRVDADGGLDGAQVPIAGAGSTERHQPKVAFNPISGEYLVVYTYGAENNNVRGRRVPAAGDPTSAEFDIATGTATQNYPDVACRSAEPGGGGYLVVWREAEGAMQDIKGQRLNQSGGLLEGVLDLCVEGSSQWSPAVAYSPDDDRYLVVWPDDRDSATQGRNVYGRQVGGAGMLFDEFAISTASGNQAPVAVTYGSGPGTYVVAWEDDRNAGTSPDLYGQRVSGSGELVDTDVGGNDPLYTGPGEQESPALAWAGAETQGLLVWEDRRNEASYDIYGLLLGPPAGGNRLFLPVVIRN